MSIADRILYEDNHLLIINKLAGEIVQGDKTGDVPLVDSVKEYLKITYNKPGNVFCGLVHRIDRPVSGAVIFAKTSKALARMNEIVKNRKISKTYLAIVEKAPEIPEQRLTDWLSRNEKANKTIVSHTEKEGYVKAELSYKIVRQLTNYTVLEVELYTGRHHQIRAQLSANGTVIKGDLKYGARRSNRDGSISLHSYKVAFEHPVTHRPVEVTAPLSGEMAKLLPNYDGIVD